MKRWVVASALLLVLDRLSKGWAQSVLSVQGSRAFWPGVVGFTYARNTGMAFSLGRQAGWLVPALTAVMVLAVLVIFLRARGYSGMTRGALLLVAAGGLGNLADRLIYGYVVDFIELQFMRFAIFNLADVGICLGAALAALGLLKKGGGRVGMDG